MYKQKRAEETKKEKKLKTSPQVAVERKLMRGFDSPEHIEIKRLTADDLDDVITILKRLQFEITEKDVKDLKNILNEGHSFGAYVDRMLVGVGLAWKVHFSPNIGIGNGESNALYMFETAVLLAYEGKGVRQALIHERIEEARRNNLKYILTIAESGEETLPIREMEVLKEQGFIFAELGDLGKIAWKKIS